MCVSLPGKVIRVKDDTAVVDYGEKRGKAVNAVKAGKGEWVLVQRGMAVEKISEHDAEKLNFLKAGN